MARRRLDLLQRLARLRRVEKMRAAAQAAEAQGVHHKLLALHQRSADIASSAHAGGLAATGDELLRRMVFASGLQAIRRQTGEESRKAELAVRDAMERLRTAERHHDVVGEQVAAQKRQVEMAAELRTSADLARNLKNR